MAVTAKEQARESAREVGRANAVADALEAETIAARGRAATAGRTAQSAAQEFGRVSASQRQAASNELTQLRAAADAVLSQKPDKAPVMHDTRRYARSMLGSYVLGGDGPMPQMGDLLWGAIHGLQGRVVQFMGGLEDAELYNAADALECQLHRACMARLRWLAGEES